LLYEVLFVGGVLGLILIGRQGVNYDKFTP